MKNSMRQNFLELQEICNMNVALEHMKYSVNMTLPELGLQEFFPLVYLMQLVLTNIRLLNLKSMIKSGYGRKKKNLWC